MKGYEQMIESVSIKWRCLGAELARLSDDEQHEFFSGFINEIYTFPTHYQSEMQLISIASKLTEKEKQNLSAICYIDKSKR